jgi:hypothetical protein
MTRDDETFLKLGKEVVRMIQDLRQVSGGETGYTRRCLTFPGGEVHVILANSPQLTDLFETVVAGEYNVESAIPPSRAD